MSDEPTSGEFRGNARFSIEDRLGEGGMGVVYRAFDREMGAQVALKTMLHVDADALLRFKNEFRSLADISHPNLVELHDLVSEGDQWFFTMELIDGVDFFEWVQNVETSRLSPSGRAKESGPASVTHVAATMVAGAASDPMPRIVGTGSTAPPPPHGAPPPERPNNAVKGPVLVRDFDRLTATLSQLVEGIMALHAAGKLHRDIKPSNVIVTPAGRAVLLDFGLVQDLATGDDARERFIVGTPAYMAPEQAAGQSAVPASDWYSLGVVLYESLTSRVPFGGETRHVFFGKQYAKPVPPSEVVDGVPPELDALCMRLLERDPGARPTGDEILTLLGASAESTTTPVRSTPFVGRGSHLAELESAFEAAAGDTPVAVFVHGKSGMGKTTLLNELLERLEKRDDVLVLSGRCYERESVPFKGLDSIVDDLARWWTRLPDDEAEALVPEHVHALSRVFPVLRTVPAIELAPRDAAELGDPIEMRRLAFAAFRRVITDVASRYQLVFHVDDLQWSDSDSAELIEHVLAPPDAPRLLLLFSHRDESTVAGPALADLRAQLGKPASGVDVRDIEVGVLPPEEALDLATASLGDEAPSEVPEVLARESQGIPFFLTELIRWQQERQARGEGDALREVATLDDVLRDRVERLSEDERRLLEVFAVANGPIEHRVAEMAAGFEQKQRTAAAHLRTVKLVRTHGLGDRDEGETFHGRIREAVLAVVEPEHERHCHGRLARALEATGRAGAEALVEHYLAAGERAEARRHVVRGADEAARGLAFRRAARLYQLAVDLGAPDPVHGLLRKSGDMLANAGRGAEAARAYLEAAASAPADDALEMRRLAAEHYLKSGRDAEGLPVLERVLGDVRLSYPRSTVTALASLVYHATRLRIRGLRYRERPASTIAARDLTRVDAAFTAAIGLSLVDVVRGADFTTRYLLSALETGEPVRICRALALEAANAAAGDDASSARANELVRTAEELAHRIDEPHALALAKVAGGLVAMFRGEWQRAIGELDEAESILSSQCRAVSWELGVARHQAANGLILAGRLAENSRRVRPIVRDARDREDLLALVNVIYPNTIALLIAGDVEGARDFAVDVAHAYGESNFSAGHWGAMISEASVARWSGQPRAGWERIERDWKRLERSQLLRVAMVRVFSVFERGLNAIGAAEQGGDSAALVRLAERNAKQLRGENLRHAAPLGHMLRASVSAFRGDSASAAADLATAVAGLDACGMEYLATCARRRRGQLLGGEPGTKLIDESSAYFAREGLDDVAACMEMTTPGYRALLT